MSRISVVAEATAKLMEIERIKNSRGFKRNKYGAGRIGTILKELTDLRYTNALCGETSINNWLLQLCREFGTQFQ